MGNLLRADFFRLWRSKSFWACMMFQVGTGVFFPSLCYIQGKKSHYYYTLDGEFAAYTAFLCILSALFCALFIGTDYSDGSVRNKLLVGHRRWEIYLSHLVTCTVACLLMCVGYLLPYLAVGTPLLAPFQEEANTLFLYTLAGLMLAVALASLYTMIAMLIPNRTVSAVVALVLSFGLLLGGSYLYSSLHYPDTYTTISYDAATGEMIEEEKPYPFYLQGAKREIYQTLCDIVPGGQAMQCAAGDAPHLPLLPVYSAALTVVTTGAGLWGFRRKDLN